MSRTGVEPKPAWRDLPLAVRAAAEGALGAAVRRAERAYGGYSPTPTYRLLLADGRRAFFKATGPADTEFARAALRRELRFYRDLSATLAHWLPGLLGLAELDDWRILLLDDAGPKSVPPWTASAARGVARALAEFHADSACLSFPDWLRPASYALRTESQLWDQLAAAGDFAHVAGLADDAAAAARWLSDAQPSLATAARMVIAAPQPQALLHGDVRSDNLRWRRGRLTLFDWPHAFAGPPEYDLVVFAQTVAVEGGPAPEQIVAWYRERRPIDDETLRASVAAVAAFFADAAWREPIPGLPRLRGFQRQQFAVTIGWAARLLDLPPPDGLWATVATIA